MQSVQGKAGYGLVLALQLTVPCTRLTLVQSLSAEYPDHPRQMFRLEVSDIQTAVALEDSEQDIRSDDLVTCCCTTAWGSYQLLCRAAPSFAVLCCVKLCLDESTMLCYPFCVSASVLCEPSGHTL